MGNDWEMVGVFPTYVLRSGAFLAGASFFVKSRPLFIKGACLDVCYDKTSLFIVKRFFFSLTCWPVVSGTDCPLGERDKTGFFI